MNGLKQHTARGLKLIADAQPTREGSMIEPMQCEWCDDEHFGEPTLLNIHGMLASEGEPACWGHSYEDSWRPCQGKASEEHTLMGEALAACEAIVKAIDSKEDMYFDAAELARAAITKSEPTNEPPQGDDDESED